LAQHALQQRIVVEHISLSWTVPQTLLQMPNDASQPRLRKRVEEKQQSRLGWERELSCIGADRFYGETLLRITLVLAEILLRNQIQSRQKFQADNLAKGIIRRHQQSSPLARSEIDKSEV